MRHYHSHTTALFVFLPRAAGAEIIPPDLSKEAAWIIGPDLTVYINPFAVFTAKVGSFHMDLELIVFFV